MRLALVGARQAVCRGSEHALVDRVLKLLRISSLTPSGVNGRCGSMMFCQNKTRLRLLGSGTVTDALAYVPPRSIA